MQCATTTSRNSRPARVAGQVNFDYTNHETQLIRKARHGDLSSFNRLVYAYQERAYRFAYRVLGDTDAAAQATQRAFVLAHQHFSDLADNSLSVWLLRLVAQACRDQRAQQARQFPQLSDSLNGARRVAPASTSTSRLSVDERALEALLQQGLATLAFEPRAVLVLADMEGYAYDQIAAITGIRPEVVQTRLATARLQLNQFLTAHQDRLPSQFRLALNYPQH